MKPKNSRYLDFISEPDFKKILTNPILDIAARFWEDDRYEAFKICYRSMRVVDDLVDDRKASGKKISNTEKMVIKKMIDDWLKAFNSKQPYDDFQEKLISTVSKFQIPLWPWQRLAKAMMFDLEYDGFETFTTFLRYSEGAAISPASVFMHLSGVRKTKDRYLKPEFDIRDSARYLALFSYLVHIVRDFEKDNLNNLNYFPHTILKKYNLTPYDLKNFAENNDYPENFRNMIREYCRFIEYYRVKACQKISEISVYLDEQYKLSYEIIYQLYLQIYEKFDWKQGGFTNQALNPTEEEVKKRLDQTVIRLIS